MIRAFRTVIFMRRMRLFISVALVFLCLLDAAFSQPARELLNSERIAQAFDSYGIEVLEGDAEFRVSNLYSTDRNERTCRTFAVVRYPDTVDPEFATEHAEILRGGSIGAIFAARGWQVRKTHLAYGEVAASPRLAALMRVAENTRLAEHLYVLDVVKDGRAYQYAALVEIHHPEYLRSDELQAIYGPATAGERAALVAALRAAAAAKMAR
jgi:hypothetical protein